MSIAKFAVLEQKLFNICIEVDSVLEIEFENSYELHPKRPERGTSANGLLDGLFRVTTSFTAGYGSQYGRGYLLIVEILTLDAVDPEFEKKVKKKGTELFQEKLKEIFPGKDLKIVYDINVYKIIGDFFEDPEIK